MSCLFLGRKVILIGDGGGGEPGYIRYMHNICSTHSIQVITGGASPDVILLISEVTDFVLKSNFESGL